MDAAQAGTGHVFFVDMTHFVFGTCLCCLWSFAPDLHPRCVRPSTVQCLGCVGRGDAARLVTVTNTTVVNTETLCELLRKIVALGLSGPITLVLDNARYQHNATVKALAKQLGITLLFLPSVLAELEPDRTPVEVYRRRALYGRYHPTFAAFQAAIQEILDGIPTTYAKPLETLMTHNFQMFEDVSLMAA